MKRNDITALKEKTVAELQKQLGELRTTLALARMDKVARKPLKNGSPSVISDDMARIKTVLTSKMNNLEVQKIEEAKKETEATE